MTIPAEYITVWSYDKQEGFDAYLASKGVPWLIRKVILMSGHVITFQNHAGGKCSVDHQMTKKSSHYDFTMGEEFTGKGFDGADHKILIALDGATIVEKHQRIDKPDDPAEIYTYSIVDGRLAQKMQSGPVSCMRYFKKK